MAMNIVIAKEVEENLLRICTCMYIVSYVQLLYHIARKFGDLAVCLTTVKINIIIIVC